jgi:regulator of protease activity HflC (stomatin/prohibitin superfamily)
MANAEGEAVKLLTASLPPGEAAMYLLGLKYLEALPALAQGKGSTIFLPAEAAGVMGAIGSMRELLRGRQADTSPPSLPGVGPSGQLK